MALCNRVWFRKFLLYAQHLLQRQPHPPSLSRLQQQLLVRRIGYQHVIQKHNVLARMRIKMVIRNNLLVYMFIHSEPMNLAFCDV